MTIDPHLSVPSPANITDTSDTGAPTPLLLITADPSHPLASLALRYARACLAASAYTDSRSDLDTHIGIDVHSDIDNDDNSPALQVFFYADGAHTANSLRWQSADQVNITKEWQSLAEQYQLRLPVCVSTALSRGISNADNSQRHQLQGDNLAAGFELVGLGELAIRLQSNCRVLQF